MSQINNSRPSDIDRSLAIFYHPLFQEITSQWTFALFRKNKIDNNENYKHPQDFQMNFLEFIEFNLKVQKCLLPQFDLSNAFVSALNDWVKEITECFNYQDLYSSNEKDVLSIKQEIERTNKESLTLPAEEYLQFIDMFKEHEAFKIVKFHITNEVFCKFLFDLCTTWCEHLDIEMFVLFLYSVFMQISEGEEGIQHSQLKNTLEIQNLKFQFFEEFERQKENYSKQKKKNLRYYRAWCEWNYLRLNEMGETVILRLSEIFGEDEEDRIYDLVSIFEKAIDTINSEITSQMGKNLENTSLEKQVNNQKKIMEKQSATVQQNELQNEKQRKANQNTANIMMAVSQSNAQQQDSLEHIGESKDLIRWKLNRLQEKEGNSQLGNEQQLQQQQQQTLKYNQIMLEQNNLQANSYNSSKQQCFEIDYDSKGNILMRKIVKIPILGKHINPQPKDGDITKNYLKHKADILPSQNYQIDTSYIAPQQKRNASAKPQRTLDNSYQEPHSFSQPFKDKLNFFEGRSPIDQIGQYVANVNQTSQNQYHPIALSSRGSSRQKSLRNSFIQGASASDNTQSKVSNTLTKKIYNNPLLEKEQQKLQHQAHRDMNKTFQKEAIETHIKKGQSYLNNTQESPNKFTPRKEIRINRKVSPGGIEFASHQKEGSSNKPYFEIQKNEQDLSSLGNRNSNNDDNRYQKQIIEDEIKLRNQQGQSKTKDREAKLQNELIEFSKQIQITSPQFEASDNSVLVPEFLRNMKAKMIQQEQIDKNLNLFDKELYNLNKTDLLNEFSNSLYQTKRNPQLDIPKKVLVNSNLVGQDELRQKVNKSFDKGKGRVKYIDQILEPNYTIQILPHPIKKNKKSQSKGERLLASPSRRFNQRDYQYEILLDDELNQLKEKSMLDILPQTKNNNNNNNNNNNQNNENKQVQPNQNMAYKRAVDRYKHVWKKYLNEQDMYMLNDWDSLYKIIIILKRKFAQDHRENYLNFLNLDLASAQNSSSQLDIDDSSTQASGEHENRFVLDKEKFQKTIQKLLKRDERRKKRRRQRNRLKQSGNSQQPVIYDIFKEKRKKFIMTKFRSRSNKQLFKDVFLLPQIGNKS